MNLVYIHLSPVFWYSVVGLQTVDITMVFLWCYRSWKKTLRRRSLRCLSLRKNWLKKSGFGQPLGWRWWQQQPPQTKNLRPRWGAAKYVDNKFQLLYWTWMIKTSVVSYTEASQFNSFINVLILQLDITLTLIMDKKIWRSPIHDLCHLIMQNLQLFNFFLWRLLALHIEQSICLYFRVFMV